MRCKDCKHWDVSAAEDRIGPEGHGVCSHEKIGEPMEVEPAADTLVYEYDEGGTILTGPDFGCVHFEAWR